MSGSTPSKPLAAHCCRIIDSMIPTVDETLMLRYYSGYPGTLLPKSPTSFSCE